MKKQWKQLFCYQIKKKRKKKDFNKEDAIQNSTRFSNHWYENNLKFCRKFAIIIYFKKNYYTYYKSNNDQIDKSLGF